MTTLEERLNAVARIEDGLEDENNSLLEDIAAARMQLEEIGAWLQERDKESTAIVDGVGGSETVLLIARQDEGLEVDPDDVANVEANATIAADQTKSVAEKVATIIDAISALNGSVSS